MGHLRLIPPCNICVVALLKSIIVSECFIKTYQSIFFVMVIKEIHVHYCAIMSVLIL